MKVNTLIIETEDGSWAIAINPLNKLKDILIKEELVKQNNIQNVFAIAGGKMINMNVPVC